MESIATSSQPKSIYAGGEKVTLDLYITANTSKPICGHFSSEIWSEITAVNKDNPYLSYGSDQPLLDVTEKHPLDYLNNAGSGYGNYFEMKATMGDEIPSGSKDGDKV